MYKSRCMKFFLFMFLLIGLSFSVNAGLEIREFTNKDQEARYNQLIDELRCLVCQNQNLADSDSQLAKDLRAKVFEMVTTNQSDKQIQEYMVNRYGEYVLYNPPLDPVTSVLWIGPFIALFAAIVLLLYSIRKRSKAAPAQLSDADHKRSKQLLEENDEDDK